MKTMRSQLFVITIAVLSLCTAMLICGCGDSGNVASLQARIDALEKKQKEDGAKLAAMSEKIVTQAIEVKNIKAAKVDADCFEANYNPREKISIGLFGIEISSLNGKDKSGSIARLDSSGLGFYDYEASSEARFNVSSGNSVEMSVKAAGGMAESTRIGFRSTNSQTGAIQAKDLNDAQVSADRAYWDPQTAANEGFSVIDTGRVSVAAKFLSLSSDGVLRFEVANISALNIGILRGSVEYRMRSGGKSFTKNVAFLVDGKMSTGKWFPVSVALEAGANEVRDFLVIKDIKVRDYFFTR